MRSASSAFSGTRWSRAGPVEDRQMDKTRRIRELNDAFRQTDADKAAVLDKIRTFDQFNGENDPHSEHDFVAIEHDGERYFAKLDYYTLDLQHGSEDPSDPAQTVRVLTVMQADEYWPPATGVFLCFKPNNLGGPRPSGRVTLFRAANLAARPSPACERGSRPMRVAIVAAWSRTCFRKRPEHYRAPLPAPVKATPPGRPSGRP